MSADDPTRTGPPANPAPASAAPTLSAPDSPSEPPATAPLPAPPTPPGDPTRSGDDAPDPSFDPASVSAPPGFTVLGRLGEGAFGTVYRAVQHGLNRVVALKTLHAGRVVGRAAVARFWAEAEAVAAVRHPHVVGVYEFGEHAGRPFLAMEFCPGGTLAERPTPVPPRDAAELMEKVARGVGAAHDQQTVHRDLKPGNILLDAAGEPKVADFGLAKRAAVEMTATQAVMGTPYYMAPEQAEGRTKFAGPPADVWALGVILYELVTGRRPFEGASQQEILARVMATDPPAARTVSRGVPRDLDTVIAKCLAKEPELRYPTANDLADDLARFVRGEPIAARPAGAVERAARWARRKPAAAAAWSLGFAVLVFGTFAVTAGILWRAAVKAKGVAEVALAGEQEAKGRTQAALAGETVARERITFLNYAHAVDLAHREYGTLDPLGITRARHLLDACPPELRNWEWGHVRRLCFPETAPPLRHPGRVHAVVFSPDGRRVATTADDKVTRIWDADTGDPAGEFPGEGPAFSPDGRSLVAVSSDRTARIWDMATGRESAALTGHTDAVYAAAFSPNSRRVATAAGDKTARVWTRDGTPLVVLRGHRLGVTRVAFSPDGERVVTASRDQTARVWHAATGRLVVALDGHSEAVVSAAFSPDGRRVVTASDDQTVRIWDADTGRSLATLDGHTGPVVSASFGPDGRRVATAGDTTVRLWEVGSWRLVTVFGMSPAGVTGLAFSPDGGRVVTAATDGSTRVWDARTGRPSATLAGHAGAVRAAAFSPDGRRVVTAADDRTARIWDAAPEWVVVTRSPLFAQVITVDRAATGGRVAVTSAVPERFHLLDRDDTTGDNFSRMFGLASSDTIATVWRSPAAGPEATLRQPWGVVRAVLSADGAKLLTGAKDGSARIWDSATGLELAAFHGHPGDVTGLAFSPDGGRVVTAATDGSTRVWDARTGRPSATLAGHAGAVRAAAFSPDGRRVVTAADDRTARIWDAASGRLLTTLADHPAGVLAVAFSPDGDRVATATDRTVRLWESRTGGGLATLAGHTGTVTGLDFSPDGRRVVTTATDGAVRVWDADTGTQLLTIRIEAPIYHARFSPDGLRLHVEHLARDEPRAMVSRTYDSEAVHIAARRIAPSPRPKP